jgi:hypothetical protein
VDAARWRLRDPEAARQTGMRARIAARRRYSLRRFLDDGDRLLKELA